MSQGLRFATDAGGKDMISVEEIVNAGQEWTAGLSRVKEPEPILPTGFAERGDVEGLLAAQGLAVPIALWRLEHIDVTITEGIVDLCDDRLGGPIRATTDPEAHGLKGKTREPREAAQPDLTCAGL